MKAKTVCTRLLVLLLAATLAFIWGNSLESVSVSDAKSQGVLTAVAPVLEAFFGSGKVTDHLVRKLAHFSEFCALGCELMLLAALRCRLSVQATVNCLSAALAAAVIDESLQLISGRGAMVADVLLDLCGGTLGIAAILLLTWLVKRKKRHLFPFRRGSFRHDSQKAGTHI